MKASILYITLAIFLLGCGEYEITELYSQRIEGCGKAIYIYDAWLGDSHKFGYRLADTSISFSLFAAIPVPDLPISYLEVIPEGNIINAIYLLPPKDKTNISLTPLRKYTINSKGIKINIKEFEQYQGYSNVNCTLKEHYFNSLEETRDSIFFYGVTDRLHSEKQLAHKVGYKKGNIKVVDSEDKNIIRIEIPQITITRGDKYIYEYGTKNIKDTIKDSPIICLKTLYLKPKTILTSSAISDYGIFKKIR